VGGSECGQFCVGGAVGLGSAAGAEAGRSHVAGVVASCGGERGRVILASGRVLEEGVVTIGILRTSEVTGLVACPPH